MGKLLTHTSDYKAFQNKTVVDILDEVLAEYPYPVEKRLVENPVRTGRCSTVKLILIFFSD